jgi:Ca2+/Na+ antiporter
MLTLPLPALLLTFTMSLLITLRTSTWFTRTLETISDMFDLSASLLSLLGALGANIPNYAASIVAIASDQFAVGLRGGVASEREGTDKGKEVGTLGYRGWLSG